jgi:hypothetical protein
MRIIGFGPTPRIVFAIRTDCGRDVLKQVQAGAPFVDPVSVTVTSKGKTTRLTIYPKGKMATTTLRTGKVPISIQIDPEDALLKEIRSGQMEK